MADNPPLREGAASNDAHVVGEKPDDDGGSGGGGGETKMPGVVIIKDPPKGLDDSNSTQVGDKADGGSRNIDAETDQRMTSRDGAQNGSDARRGDQGESSAGTGSITGCGEQHSPDAHHIPVKTDHIDSKDGMSVEKGVGDNDMDVEGNTSRTDKRATTTSSSTVPGSTAAKEGGAMTESYGAGEAATSDRRVAKVPGVTAEEETRGPASCSDQAWDDFDQDECFICFDGGEIILCDYCDRSYHLQCHRPSLKRVPDGEFKCMECVAVSTWGAGSAPSTGGGRVPNTSRGKKRAEKDKAPDFLDLSGAKKYVGARVAKRFDGDVYFGSVTQYNEKTQFWHVVYDDDDEEDYDPNDLEKAGILYRKERKGDDPKKSRGAQQRYFRKNKPKKAHPPPKKKKKVEKPKPARPKKKAKRDSSASLPTQPPPSRPKSPIVESLPPKYCIIQVPQGAKPGDIVDVVFPGDEFTSQIVCPDFVQHSPYVTVVAPGGYRPPSAPMNYARTNADRLCDGLPADNARPFVVDAFNSTLWPALKEDGWKRVDVQETGNGSMQFIPPENRFSLSDSAGRLGLGFYTSYHGVISFCADADEYKEIHAAFEVDCIVRKETAERLAQMERDMHYLSSKPHVTPIGPDHQASDLPLPRDRDIYLWEKQGSLRAESCQISWSPKFVNIATNEFLKNLSAKNRARYDLEAALEIFWSYDYNDIAARAVITMPIPPDESWKIGVDEMDFEARLKASNHDLKKVADALGIHLVRCSWYYYHCYRPCRQWDMERDKDTFHDAVLKARGNLRKAATILGKRYDSCLWFYDSKYRFSLLHQEYKKEENRIIELGKYCALCEETGEDLLPCCKCPKCYHTSCLSLEEGNIPEGDWICPACNPGFPCPHCLKRFRTEGGLSNHLRLCEASQSSDSGDDSSSKNEKETDDRSASSNCEAEKKATAPSASLPVSAITSGVSASAVDNPSTRSPGVGKFPIPPNNRNRSIPRTNVPKEVEAMDPATMTRLRLFVSVSYAARMSDLNRTALAKICKEGGGILNGVFYRFTTDEPNCSQTGQKNEIKTRKALGAKALGGSTTSTSKDLISRIEKEWASKEAKIEAAQAGRALALTEEPNRLEEQEAQPHVSDRTEGNTPDAQVQIMPAVSSQNSLTTTGSVGLAAASSAQAASDAGNSPNQVGNSFDENDVLI